MKDAMCGLLFVLLGVVMIYVSYRFPIKKHPGLPTLSGYIGGIGSVILGLKILFDCIFRT